ncbi:hypothetical protein Ancab_017021 [Ancistrocladus abbreviatus]
MGKSHTDTGDMHHHQSYVDAVKGRVSRTGLKHNLADMQHNGEMAPKTGLKHNVVSMQNNEKPLLVFTSKAEDGVWLKKCYYGELTSIYQALDLDHTQLHLVRESPEENVGQRIEMESTRKEKTKSMAEISGSKVSTGKNGCRSMRVQRKLLDTGLPRSSLFIEVADSGIDPNDSQIENMNRLICKQDFQQADKEPSPTLS